jgi:hypothetical protein
VIRVHIERLVLDGVAESSANAEVWQSAVQHAMAQVLGAPLAGRPLPGAPHAGEVARAVAAQIGGRR